MANDSSKIVATRNYLAYYVPYSATNALPASTVAYGTAWATPSGQASPWINPGYTDGGLHFSTEVQRQDIRVDQELDPVLRPATSRTASMNTNLAQFAASLLAVATGQGSVVSLAATTAARGYDDFILSSTITDNFYSMGFEVQAQDNEAIRFVGWRTEVSGTPTFNITPTEKLVTPLNMTLFPDTSTSPARIATIRDMIPIG